MSVDEQTVLSPRMQAVLGARSFFPKTEVFDNAHALIEENPSKWDRFYRDRWSHDKVVRSTHGVNCAGP